MLKVTKMTVALGNGQKLVVSQDYAGPGTIELIAKVLPGKMDLDLEHVQLFSTDPGARRKNDEVLWQMADKLVDLISTLPRACEWTWNTGDVKDVLETVLSGRL